MSATTTAKLPRAGPGWPISSPGNRAPGCSSSRRCWRCTRRAGWRCGCSWSNPSTAMITVAVVMHPHSGMVLAKSFYRALGTLAGSAVRAGADGAVSAAARVVLPGPVSLWLALCAGGATLYRNFMAYGFVLAGYTAAIVALPAVGNPLDGVRLGGDARERGAAGHPGRRGVQRPVLPAAVARGVARKCARAVRPVHRLRARQHRRRDAARARWNRRTWRSCAPPCSWRTCAPR